MYLQPQQIILVWSKFATCFGHSDHLQGITYMIFRTQSANTHKFYTYKLYFDLSIMYFMHEDDR